MNRPLVAGAVAALMLLIVLLAAKISLEWARPMTLPGVDAGKRVEAAPTSVPMMGARDLPKLRELAEVTERPLFNSTRRPHVVEADGEDAESGAELDEADLIGIFEHGSGRRALLRLADNSEARSVASGDQILGWTVVEVGEDRIVLRRNAETHVLKLNAHSIAPARPRRLPRDEAQPDPSGYLDVDSRSQAYWVYEG